MEVLVAVGDGFALLVLVKLLISHIKGSIA
jgi:hypothetical protein